MSLAPPRRLRCRGAHPSRGAECDGEGVDLLTRSDTTIVGDEQPPGLREQRDARAGIDRRERASLQRRRRDAADDGHVLAARLPEETLEALSAETSSAMNGREGRVAYARQKRRDVAVAVEDRARAPRCRGPGENGEPREHLGLRVLGCDERAVASGKVLRD